MNYEEKIRRRCEFNLEIVELVHSTGLIPLCKNELLELVHEFPQQRFGQLVCNYICQDYRFNPSDVTQRIMDNLFDIEYDPFFEESADTLERLTKKYKS